MHKPTTPTLLLDFYKVSHRVQYPNGTQVVYAGWTPRTCRIPGVTKIVAFGFQGFIKKYLIDYFNEYFFNRPKEEVIQEYSRMIKYTLGDPNPHTKHLEELHDLGYLPILIKALPEGTLVPIRVPMFTIENTDNRFFWLTNSLETLMSCEQWLPSTSATIAHEYHKILMKWAEKTGDPLTVQFQGHDFSMRGMGSVEDAQKSGAGHLLSFVGTDTVPAISYLESYYNANIEKELVGCSISATEHSVSCAGGKDNEHETYRRLIEDVYPSGFLSIVSDTWDLWNVLTNIIPSLKNSIMSRDGRIVIRPDSGDPIKIMCGDPSYPVNSPQWKGVIQLLWDTFGGTINDKGYAVLDSHIGAIYGDAITMERCDKICEGLADKEFASTNMVFGIGSFTYQYNTRDTCGFALKSTDVTINDEEIAIWKDPITDDGTKKSATGRLAVVKKNGILVLIDGLTDHTYADNDLFEPAFYNGSLMRDESLATIRKRLSEQE